MKRRKIEAIILIILEIVLVSFLAWRLYQRFGYEENAIKTENVANPQLTTSEIEAKKFREYHKKFPDMVGIIDIPDTHINYPIAQKNNEIYLTHAIDGSYDINGAIFLDMHNDIYQSLNLFIYGHNMMSRKMFSDLVKFRDESYMKQHRTFRINDGKYLRTNQVVAAYEINVKETYFEPQQMINLSEAQLKEVFKPLKAYYDDWQINQQKPMTILATCLDDKGEKRILVIGREVERLSFEKEGENTGRRDSSTFGKGPNA